MNWYKYPKSWSFILRAYLPRLAICSLIWEIVQLPLYTLWLVPNLAWIAYAVAHCTVGDIMIGTVTLLTALILTRANEPANWPKTTIVILMVFLSVSYTVFSERSNLTSESWAYSSWMPILPWLNVGLAPLLQWAIVPSVAWWWASHHSSHDV